MDKSINSSMNKTPCSKEAMASPEESGWTMYFEEFLASENCSSSRIDGGSSMVSDAASCVPLKLSAKAEASESCKKLSFKRRKAMGVLDDDPLEDTASSPVNSPKVSGLNHLDMNPRRKDYNRDISQENGVCYRTYPDLRMDEINELGLIENKDECTELKKKGLCLVPFSMLVDYLG